MHNSPISKDFYKDIVNVLSGKTTTKMELPVSLVESANQAAVDLAHAFLDGGTVSLEKKRDILRKNLKEGAAKCGCTLNPEMIARFEELSAQAPVAEQTIDEAKASPQEDEFLTDLTAAQIAAISPLMKSKDWNKLKAYLMSQKIVDKNFDDIQGYKMDRDVLSVLQRSFKDYHEQVETVEANEVTEEIVDTDTKETETTADQLVEMSAGLTQFIAQLNQDEVRILKNLLSNH